MFKPFTVPRLIIYTLIMGSISLPFLFIYLAHAKWILSPQLNIPWDRRDPFFEISPGASICQIFFATEKKLSRIDVMLRSGGGKYQFTLSEILDEKESLLPIRSGIFSNKAQNYGFLSLVFDPIVNSKNMRFSFCLKAYQNNKNSIAVFKSSSVIYPFLCATTR